MIIRCRAARGRAARIGKAQPLRSERELNVRSERERNNQSASIANIKSTRCNNINRSPSCGRGLLELNKGGRFILGCYFDDSEQGNVVECRCPYLISRADKKMSNDSDENEDYESGEQGAGHGTFGEALGYRGGMPAIHGVSLEVSAVLGTANMPVSQLLKMGRGAVVELDKHVGDTIEISINKRVIATGEVMIRGEHLCVEVQEILRR